MEAFQDCFTDGETLGVTLEDDCCLLWGSGSPVRIPQLILTTFLVLHYLSVGLDASPPLGDTAFSCHQPLHHFPLLLLLDQVLGNTPPPIFPPGQVILPVIVFFLHPVILVVHQFMTHLTVRLQDGLLLTTHVDHTHTLWVI